MNDPPIFLGGADSKLVPVYLFQSHLNGLCALIHFCHGLERGGAGTPPGMHELIMHYRELAARVREEPKQ